MKKIFQFILFMGILCFIVASSYKMTAHAASEQDAFHFYAGLRGFTFGNDWQPVSMNGQIISNGDYFDTRIYSENDSDGFYKFDSTAIDVLLRNKIYPTFYLYAYLIKSAPNNSRSWVNNDKIVSVTFHNHIKLHDFAPKNTPSLDTGTIGVSASENGLSGTATIQWRREDLDINSSSKTGDTILVSDVKYNVQFEIDLGLFPLSNSFISNEVEVKGLMIFEVINDYDPNFSVEMITNYTKSSIPRLSGSSIFRRDYSGCTHISLSSYINPNNPHDNYCPLCHRNYIACRYETKYDVISHWGKCACGSITAKETHNFYYDGSRYWCRNCPYNAKNIIVGPQLVMQKMLEQINPLPSILDKLIEN